MAKNGTSLINAALTIAQDESGVSWPRAELLDWLNLGLLDIAIARPESSVFNGDFTLATGVSKQTLPAGALALIDVVCNTGDDGVTYGHPVTIVSKETMDAVSPTWRSDANTLGRIAHYAFDPRDPKHFYVWPKAPGSTWHLELVYSVTPAALGSEASNIPIDDIYSGALLDYMLYRAYSKNAEEASMLNLATLHYQAFAQALGIKTANDSRRNPNRIYGGDTPAVPVPQ